MKLSEYGRGGSVDLIAGDGISVGSCDTGFHEVLTARLLSTHRQRKGGAKILVRHQWVAEAGKL